MKKLFLVALFILATAFPHKTLAAAFYVDFTCATDGIGCSTLGTATTTPFNSIQLFSDVARNPGDIAFVRRGVASTTNVTAATFTSDGILNNPITISADYDNLWNENSTSSETVTVTTWGSTTGLTASASTTIPYGSWIYLQGDCAETFNSKTLNPCEYAYEVASSSAGTPNTTITLYLPYKGKQTGAGINVRIMRSAPQVGDVTQANQIFTMSSDDYWYFKGLDLRSNNATCITNPSQNNRATSMFDMVFQSNGAANDCAVNSTNISTSVKKTRAFNVQKFNNSNSGFLLQDVLIDCNNIASSQGIGNPSTGALGYLKDATIKNCVADFSAAATAPGQMYYFTNVKRINTFSTLTASAYAQYFYQDDFDTVGLNSQSSNQISSNTAATTTLSSSANLRSGGGPTNLLVFPPSGTGNTGISTAYFPLSYIKLFEYPIYAAASVAKTYTVYFNSTSTAQWTTNPVTASSAASSTPELFIECEYYNDATDANRMLTRSNVASAINFTGSTAWQSLSVTCTPAQSGILYLRGWYGKPKETTGGDIFYMDTTPVVS